MANYGLHMLAIFTCPAGGAASTTSAIINEQQEIEDDLREAQAFLKELNGFVAEIRADLRAYAKDESAEKLGQPHGGSHIGRRSPCFFLLFYPEVTASTWLTLSR